jgi:mannose-6-phosphate isomerase
MGGLLIAEIQQNSNTTYRVYDWGRTGAEGKPRPLHVDKALDVINFSQIAAELCAPKLITNENGVRRSLLCETDYFTTERVEIASGATFQGNCTGETMEIWGVTEGAVALNDLALSAVRFVLLPAAMREFTVTAVSSPHFYEATSAKFFW